MSFVLVHEAPDDRAAGRIGAPIEIADLVEECEDLLARSGPDAGGRRRRGRHPPHKGRELSLLGTELRRERALARRLPIADGLVEGREP